MSKPAILKTLRPIKRNAIKFFRGLKELAWGPYLQQITDAGVIILWATHSGKDPGVQYYTNINSKSVVNGGSKTIDYRVQPWSSQGIQLHRVELSGLQPNTTYHYKIYLADQDLLPNQTFSFQTAPITGSDLPFTFIVFGDYGNGSESQKRLRNQMLDDSFNFILTVGDNSQSFGTYEKFDYTVFQLYQDIFCKAGLFTTMGNHDYETDQGEPYLNLFDLPCNAWRSNDCKRYYSFDYGSAHFTVLDSNAPLDVDDAKASDDMLDWLRDDLSHTSQRWKIVACHHPPYNAGDHGPDIRVQTKLVPIFEDYGVQLVFSGHQHNYQRSKPLQAGRVVPLSDGGIVYIVSGAGAAAKHACVSADWLDFSISSVNYGLYNRVKVTRDRLIIEAVDDIGNVRDDYIISKTQLPKPQSLAKTLL